MTYLSKSLKFRKALLELHADTEHAPRVTIQDVIAKWSLLSPTGYSPVDVFKMANEEDIPEDAFKKLMMSLNRSL